MEQLRHRDKPLFGSMSAVGAIGDGCTDATMAMWGEEMVEAHNAVHRQDAAIHSPQTTQHWRDVLLYLLDHPAIEVNAGFY
ncbi:hypothetical protein JKF63_04580 [Porcisia hertigi]|uniref:Uncharacterized protein n=1 Tax=Porcisia hertigi TaxID=2761500 RepID=A0A836HN18_9TRYP|nr:hypothetical protein JKF63_04580 [Porcisia hertigi]